uniref:BED-type domain-containing protein n=1 Tax=Leptobrachium leishanense TaxID=445787 RepID=A0A8C5LQ09_9ANUR
MSERPKRTGRRSQTQIRGQAASVSGGCAPSRRGRGASSAGARLSLFLTGAGHLKQQQHTEDLVDWLTRPSSSSESSVSQACSGLQSTSAAKTSNSASMSTATPAVASLSYTEESAELFDYSDMLLEDAQQVQCSDSNSESAVVSKHMYRKSAVWEFFKKYATDRTIAICNLCQMRLKRGKDTGRLGTTCLRRHMTTCHASRWHNTLHRSSSSSSVSTPTICPAMSLPTTSTDRDVPGPSSECDSISSSKASHVRAAPVQSAVVSKNTCRNSAVWEFFKKCAADTTVAICNLCQRRLKRGINTGCLGTTCLRRHMNKCHTSHWAKLCVGPPPPHLSLPTLYVLPCNCLQPPPTGMMLQLFSTFCTQRTIVYGHYHLVCVKMPSLKKIFNFILAVVAASQPAKMSAVWKYFTVSEKDNKFAVCTACSAEVSRGGTTPRNFSTTGLIHHLKAKHPVQHAEYAKEAAKLKKTTPAASTSSSTPSVATLFQKITKFTSDSPKAHEITEKVMEFIALDDQPFSVVEDIGFRRLMQHIEPRYTLPSRRYFAETCLPATFERVAKHVQELMNTDIPALSFTTDIWSSDVSPTSMLSLTAQWIDADFKIQNILLNAQEFLGSHTAAAIAGALTNMLQTWQIEKDKVHVVLRDNARNMAKAMEDCGLKSLPCMAHTLQLAVHEGLLSQRSISDIIANGRKIVGHFKHSQLAYSRLQTLQIQFGLPPKRLQQDVPTRWNSTYYMLGSLLEQKRVLAAYVADHDLPATLSAHQWMLVENILSILAPFEQLTKEISASKASVAEVIPMIAALKRLLGKEVPSDHGVKTAKQTLLDAINKRFEDAHTTPLYCIATGLDPRFKEHYFDADTKRRTREMIHSSGTTNAAAQQLEVYLAELPINRSDNPLDYWRMNKERFPVLALMARRYLSAPSTSTESERLFSAASHVLNEKRNRLSCDKAEQLLFLKRNLPLLLK